MSFLGLVDRGAAAPSRFANAVQMFHDEAPALFEALVKPPSIKVALYMGASSRIGSTCRRRGIDGDQQMLMHQLASSLIVFERDEAPRRLDERNANFVRVIVETEIAHYRVHHPIRARLARSAA